MNHIYFDHSASTPVREEVIDAMADCLRNSCGNPSSIHWSGNVSRKLLQTARKTIAKKFGVNGEQVIFTSGGTEANNLAIQGAVHSEHHRGRHIVTSSIEHKSVLNTARYLQKIGFDLTILPVTGSGTVRPDDLEKAIRPDTVLVSVMAANNEIGTIEPFRELAAICRDRKILFHTDAVQAVGKIDLDFSGSGVDMLSFSSHKINGPKGAGALIIRKGTVLEPLIRGGAHENGFRAGTENLPGIVGMARATEYAFEEREKFIEHVSGLRSLLESRLLKALPEIRINGDLECRLPHLTHISFPGVRAADLQAALDANGIAVSSGSACSSDETAYSDVLKAIGLDPVYAEGSIRISFGRSNTPWEVDHFVNIVVPMVKALQV